MSVSFRLDQSPNKTRLNKRMFLIKTISKFVLPTFFLLCTSLTTNATVENTAFLSVGPWLVLDCEILGDECDFSANEENLTIETSSMTELFNSLSAIRGISTLDGQVHNYTINWTANFPFAVDQISSDYASGDTIQVETIYPFASQSPTTQLIDNGDDLVRIINPSTHSGSFEIALGFLDAPGTEKDFRFRPNPVPLPVSIWLFGSSLATLGFYRRKLGC